MIDFGYSNSYRSVLNATEHNQYSLDLDRYCVPPLETCRTSSSSSLSSRSNSNSSCAGILPCLNGYSDIILSRLAAAADLYDIRLSTISASEIREATSTQQEKYLSDPAVMAAIGAKTNYTYCSTDVSADFAATGDCKLFPPLLPTPLLLYVKPLLLINFF